LELFSHFKA